MSVAASVIANQVNPLVDQYRTQCLWFIRPDYYPTNPVQAIRILEAIESHADREGYVKAKQIRKWLLHHFKNESAG